MATYQVDPFPAFAEELLPSGTFEEPDFEPLAPALSTAFLAPFSTAFSALSKVLWTARSAPILILVSAAFLALLVMSFRIWAEAGAPVESISEAPKTRVANAFRLLVKEMLVFIFE